VIAAVFVAGSFVFCLLVVVATHRYLSVPRPSVADSASVSILKPLAGADEGLAENLRSYFEQDYPSFEILFAVREAGDPAVAIVEQLRAAYPHIPSRLLIVGEPPYANAKVWSLFHMTAAAAHDWLAMADSDVRVTPDFLRSVVGGPFDLATCPYRAVPGSSFWSKLEAIGMNTEFLAGILTARMLEGMKFAVGPTIVARRKVIEVIGGWDRVKDYLAEDFVLGQFAAEAGFQVGLSQYVIEHRIGSQAFVANAKHRLRWNRSTRRSRPAGYVGQVFTNPTPFIVLLLATAPEWWPLAVAGAVARVAAAWATAGWVLHDPLCRRYWWLVPLEDLASFVYWLGGFFGNTIVWRGRRYYLRRDGRFERL